MTTNNTVITYQVGFSVDWRLVASVGFVFVLAVALVWLLIRRRER